MFNRFCLYTQLTFLDILRLWSSVQHHVIIVSGICLPILLLLGLKNGHLAELRKDLLQSPTGRQVVFWAGQGGNLMTDDTLQTFKNEIQSIDLLIPELQRVVTMECNGKNADHITLYSTREGDPILAQHGITIKSLIDNESPSVVVSSTVAEKLDIKIGDTVQMKVVRSYGGKEEIGTTNIIVSSIIPSLEGTKSMTGFAPFEFLLDLERFVMGQQVSRYSWASMNIPAKDTYAGYLIFTEKNDPLSTEDIKTFDEKGYEIHELDDPFMKTLGGVFKDEAKENLLLYHLTLKNATNNDWGQLTMSPSEISRFTGADDIVVPWNTPKKVKLKIDGKQSDWTIIGISFPKTGWFKVYLNQPEFFTYFDEPLNILPLNIEIKTNTVLIDSMKNVISLNVKKRANAENNVNVKNHFAVVPLQTLSYFYAHEHNVAEYDNEANMFIPKAKPPVFDKVRAYALSIDEVPDVVKALKKRNYAVMSEETRISEIHQQDNSLWLLVCIVGLGVFLFGVITVVSVLLDSTDRKRGTIGIMRVMGVSRIGIFYIIFLRSLLIGCFAIIVTIFFGYLVSFALMWQPSADIIWLQWKPIVQINFLPFDLIIVLAGALFCCSFGALIPSRKASRMDPFDAIMEGRFR
ncbi:MAG: ABC transporter permease [Planctomycetaceae bacterium]|nr:ABC transporter permease [Planctomycetaceae bacterium]